MDAGRTVNSGMLWKASLPGLAEEAPNFKHPSSIEGSLRRQLSGGGMASFWWCLGRRAEGRQTLFRQEDGRRLC